MAGDPLISGTAAAVVIGFGSIIASIFAPGISFGESIILFFLGILFVLLGLRFSQA